MPVLLNLSCLVPLLIPAPDGEERLRSALGELLAIWQGRVPATVTALVHEGERETLRLRWGRGPQGEWMLGVRAGDIDAWLSYERRIGAVLGLDHRDAAIVGRGAPAVGDPLEWEDLLAAAATRHRELGWALGFLNRATPGAAMGMLRNFAGLEAVAGDPDRFRLGFAGQTAEIVLAPGAAWIRELRVDGGPRIAFARAPFSLPRPVQGRHRLQPVARFELELAIRRGAMRALEILDADARAEPLADGEESCDAGRLVVREGQRVLLLHGTPAEIGAAHGELLAGPIRRNIEATLYVVGFVYTVEKGRWFLDEIRGAWRRLVPHLDPAELAELDALAVASEMPLEEVQLANVFPALFHCSGFAVAGSATADGSLYHGRVLDYMTEIGLQRNAALMVVAQPGRVPFASIGYAGFTGSVGGMNARGVSIGEMGGRGEGAWDGVPMAFLLRRALERAEGLDEAIEIFKSAPRTCEYFYVISEGRTRKAVGVGAWPERMELIGMGAAHPLLPEAVEDAVLLSAGGRYRELVRRVRAAHGTIDRRGALELMELGVAMRSALHTALFVPGEMELWVAHAGIRGNTPAPTNPYVRHDLRALFAQAIAIR